MLYLNTRSPANMGRPPHGGRGLKCLKDMQLPPVNTVAPRTGGVD